MIPTFTGKNKDFKVIFDCERQHYVVYKSNKYLIKKYRFSDVKCYLN